MDSQFFQKVGLLVGKHIYCGKEICLIKAFVPYTGTNKYFR